MNKLFNIGITSATPDYLIPKIKITNIFVFVLFWVGIIFGIVSINYPGIFLLTLLGPILSLAVWWLNYNGFFLAARFATALLPIIVTSIIHAIIVQPGDPIIPGLLIGQFAIIIAIYIVFDYHEWRVIALSSIIAWSIFLLQGHINQWIDVPINSSYFYQDFLYYITNVFNICIITFGLFFFIRKNHEHQQQKEQLIEVLQHQKSALTASNDIIAEKNKEIEKSNAQLSEKVRISTEKIREREQRLSAIYNGMKDPTGLVAFDDQGNFIINTVNQAFLDTLDSFGYTNNPDLLIGRDLVDLWQHDLDFSPEEITERLAIFEKVKTDKIILDYQASRVYPGLGRFILESTLTPILDDHGNCVSILFIMRDVTEKILAAKKLKDKEQLLSTIYNTVKDPTGLVSLNQDGTYIFESVNQAYIDSLKMIDINVSRKDIEGKPTVDCWKNIRKYSPSRIKTHLAYFDQVIQTKQKVEFDFIRRGKNGEERFYNTVFTPVIDHDGQSRSIVFHLQDRTEEIRALREIQKSQSQLSLIYDNTPDVIALIRVEADGQLIMQSQNETAWSIINSGETILEKRDFIEIKLEEFYKTAFNYDDALIAKRVNMLQAVVDSKESIEYEGTVTIPSGSTQVHFRNIASPILNEKGECSYILFVTRDVTKRKKAEKELQYRLQFESLLTRLSNQFININIEDLDQEIIFALQQIGAFTNFDRAFVNLLSDDKKYIFNNYEWCKEGVDPVGEQFQKVPLEDFPYLRQKLDNNGHILIKKLSDLPKEADNYRKAVEGIAVKSFVQVPLTWGGNTIGLIGFDSLKEIEKWPKDLIILLRFAGEMITKVLQRKKSEEALRKSEHQLSMVFNNTKDFTGLAKVVSEDTFTVEAINQAAFDFLTHVIKKPVIDLQRKNIKVLFEHFFDMSEEEIEHRVQLIKQATSTLQPISMTTKAYVKKIGRLFYFDLTISPVILDGVCTYVLYVARNITDQVLAKEALIESEKRMSSVFNSTNEHMAIYNVEKNGRITLEQVNKSLKDSWENGGLEFDLNSFIGEDFVSFASTILMDSEDKIAERFALLQKVIKTKTPHHAEEEFSPIKGEKIYMDVSTYPILDDEGNCTKILMVTRDITFKKKANERIISNMIETEDRERRRIAKELHDSLGQNLTTASLNLNHLKAITETMTSKYQQKLNTGLKFLNIAIDESRNIAHNLMPQSISDFGYAITIDSLLEDLNNSGTIEFIFYNNLKGRRLAPDIELSLFRITQEAINNILKHAKATKVTIQLMEHPDIILLTIEDDGVGFNISKNKNSTFGLDSISTRVKALSGKVNIDSSIKSGTSITIEIPNLVEA